MHDIELIPGPDPVKDTLTIVIVNFRGLGNNDKFCLILNKAQDYIYRGPAVICLQETMVTTDRYLELAWLGKYVHTPGFGNS